MKQKTNQQITDVKRRHRETVE